MLIIYILRRVGWALLTLLFLIAVIFFVTRLTTNPALIFAGEDATPERLAEVKTQLGLDHSLPVQFWYYLINLVQGDAGESWSFSRPVTEMVFDRFPATLKIGLVGAILGILIAIPLGTIAAIYRGRLPDSVARLVAVLTSSMPVFWTGMLLILLFAVQLHWFPSGGNNDSWKSAVLPGIALCGYILPVTTRITRSSLLSVLGQDYVRTARSKGLRESVVVVKHALRNAMVPVITIVMLSVGHIFAGAVTLELVFSYPGVGDMVIKSLLSRDLPAVQFIVLFIGAIVILANLLADVLYALVDPRIRLS